MRSAADADVEEALFTADVLASSGPRALRLSGARFGPLWVGRLVENHALFRVDTGRLPCPGAVRRHPPSCEVHDVSCPHQPRVGSSDSSGALATGPVELVTDLLEVAVVVDEVGKRHPLAASGSAARYSAKCNDVLLAWVTPSNKMWPSRS